MEQGFDFESRRIRAYFAQLAAHFGGATDVQIIAVAHMVSNSVHFLPALDSLGRIALLLPKPSARDSDEAEVIRSYGFREGVLSRDWASDPDMGVSQILDAVDESKPVVVVDIGGYFRPLLRPLANRLGDGFLGVMEGTENGVQKYEESDELSVPVVTVARSPLKLPEDYLVGASIVYSVEAILRSQAQILQTRTACVIGYGRVGSGVAEVLRGRGIPTVVHDNSPIAMAEAAARGFQVYRRLDEALSISSLVVSATGSHAIDAHALGALRSGCLVATVTSADDEFSADSPLSRYRKSVVSERHGDLVVRYDGDNGKYFWLANDGKAANFAHGAVIGPAIQLIEGEKLAAVMALADRVFPVANVPQELATKDRVPVARIWNEHFLAD